MRGGRLLAEKEAEVLGLVGLSLAEVMPSRRDFTMFVATHKDGLALVPRIKRSDPITGAAWPNLDVVGLARACDDAEAAALAVCTAALCHGAIDDLRAVAAAVTAPVLRDDWCIDASQLYHARLFGADAIVLPAAHLDGGGLRELSAVASSLHMASVIEVSAAGELPRALAVSSACLGLWCPGRDGFSDLAQVRTLAEQVPRQRTVLLLSEVRVLSDLHQLDGKIDAAVVGNPLLDAGDPAAQLAAFFAER